jgi:hypothetical protein
MPRFGSELQSEPEPDRTRPKFSPGFRVGAKPDQRSCPGFGGGGRTWRNHSEPGLNPEPEGPLVVVAALCPTSSLPCAPHHRRPVPCIAIDLCPSSLSPCALCHCHSARHVVISLHAASPLPCTPHRGPVRKPANPNLCGRITGFSVRFWFSPWRTPNRTVRTVLSGSGSGSEKSPNQTTASLDWWHSSGV